MCRIALEVTQQLCVACILERGDNQIAIVRPIETNSNSRHGDTWEKHCRVVPVGYTGMLLVFKEVGMSGGDRS